MGYFCSSDWHFGHKRILEFERDRFQKIEEHDQFLLKTIRNYFQCNIEAHDTFYFLGDLGVPSEAVASSLYALFADAYKEAMKGIYTSCVRESTIDESPMSYKNADEIARAIEPNGEIVARLRRPLYNYKAV